MGWDDAKVRQVTLHFMNFSLTPFPSPNQLQLTATVASPLGQ